MNICSFKAFYGRYQDLIVKCQRLASDIVRDSLSESIASQKSMCHFPFLSSNIPSALLMVFISYSSLDMQDAAHTMII